MPLRAADMEFSYSFLGFYVQIATHKLIHLQEGMNEIECRRRDLNLHALAGNSIIYAGGGSRTPMPLRTADFESAMYTNFITPARRMKNIIRAHAGLSQL